MIPRSSLLLKLNSPSNIIVRCGSYGYRHVVRDKTNKSKNEKIVWSTGETDSSTLKRDEYKMKYPYKDEDGGIKYLGFKYYPR